MKKIGLLILVFFSLFVVSGCQKNKGELEDVNNIKVEDIFNQKESKYYVYFHKLDCEDCESTDPYIIQYAALQKLKGCQDKRPIYAVLLYTKSEKPGQEIYIYRQYTGTDGQGTDGKYYVDGVTRWQDLYIASTSSLIAINTRPDGVKEARYVAQCNSAVVSALNTHYGQCYSK